MKEGVSIGGIFIPFNDGPRPRRTSDEVKPKVERRMARIDALTREQRLVVHEYGWNLVDALIQNGVTSPTRMRSIINAVTHNCVDRMYRSND